MNEKWMDKIINGKGKKERKNRWMDEWMDEKMNAK